MKLMNQFIPNQFCNQMKAYRYANTVLECTEKKVSNKKQ